MTTLEATVEIVKSAVSSNNADSSSLITFEKTRQEFLAGIEAIYKKLQELENKK